MAQKTPIPALTVSISGTWNSLWYYDFTYLQHSWKSQLQLNYVLGAFFAVKRRLAHCFSVLKNNHIVHVNAQIVVLAPSAESLRPRKKWVGMKQLKQIHAIRKYNDLSRRLLSVRSTPNSSLYYYKQLPKLGLPAQWSSSLLDNKGKLTPARNFYNLARVKNKHSMYRRHFSLAATEFSAAAERITRSTIKRIAPNTQKSISEKPSAAFVIAGAEAASVLPRSLYQHWHRSWKIFARLRPRDPKRSFIKSYKILSARTQSYATKFHDKSNYTQLFSLTQACQNVSGFRVQLTVRRLLYKPGVITSIKNRAVFSRWANRNYFMPTASIVLLSLMRGSSLLLINWLLRLLKTSKTHSSTLFLVIALWKYFLQDSATARLNANMPCSGARIEVVGKLDGRDRASTFRSQVGAIPTSSLSASIDMEYAACGTIYGTLGVTIWYYIKAEAPLMLASSHPVNAEDSTLVFTSFKKGKQEGDFIEPKAQEEGYFDSIV